MLHLLSKHNTSFAYFLANRVSDFVESFVHVFRQFAQNFTSWIREQIFLRIPHNGHPRLCLLWFLVMTVVVLNQWQLESCFWNSSSRMRMHHTIRNSAGTCNRIWNGIIDSKVKIYHSHNLYCSFLSRIMNHFSPIISWKGDFRDIVILAVALVVNALVDRIFIRMI